MEDIEFRYTFSLKSHYILDGVDELFYFQLPAHDRIFWEKVYDDAGNLLVDRRVEGIPPADEMQFFTVIGSALLSSSVIATAIKAWLDTRKRKITISIDGTTKKVEYEGPNIKQDIATIQAMIDQLAEESDKKGLRINVTYLSEGDTKAVNSDENTQEQKDSSQ